MHGVVYYTAGTPSAGERRLNEVRIHAYNLLVKDALVKMMYFTCNFPIGQYFKMVNNGCHVLGKESTAWVWR